MQKFLFCISLVIVSCLVGTVPVYAVSTTTGDTNASTAKTTLAPTKAEVENAKKKSDDALVAYKAARTTDRLAKLQALGDRLIDQRVSELKRFESQTFKGVSVAKVAEVKTNVDTTITKLNDVKSKIDASTAVDEVKTLVQSIYDDYHVYAVFLPIMHLTVAIAQTEATMTKLSDITGRMQKAIDTQKTAGQDTAALEAALKDYSTQLTEATATIVTAKSQLAKMDVKNVDTSKTSRDAARDSLKKVRANLVAARGDLKTFQDALSTKTTAPKTSTTAPAATSTKTSNTPQ